jgi:glycine/D-amino acid oxidase-like deaminating enzyme/nitrite reductase/ring-hydroxylating ferredoxin subunit
MFTERTLSLWKATSTRPQDPPLDRDLRADVCVVGAGIAGLSVALHLAKAGARVVVLERYRVGAGETAQSTAHLASAIDDRFENLERLHGPDGARVAYESHQAAIERIGEICEAEGIGADYVRLDGFLILGPGADVSDLEREGAAAWRAGFRDVTLERSAPAGFDTGPCLRFPRQGRVHPLRYVHGMAAALERLGGRIHGASEVVEVTGGADAGARTRGGRVSCAAVVVATNTPFHDRFAVHTKQEPYRTYAIAAEVRPGAVQDALFWDTADPYHYVRLSGAGAAEPGRPPLLVLGGEDHRTGQSHGTAPFEALETWGRERFPLGEVVHRWSGQVFEPVDGLGFIGRHRYDDPNVYLATGDSGQGITHGTIAGMLISDLILGRPNPWAALYDPGRVRLRAAAVREFLRHNVGAARHMTEHLRGAPGQVSSSDEIPPGGGAILRQRGSPVAVHRDAEGRLHVRSAVCTHLGCLVHWNEVESSWDCPCHGSRFAPTGEVLTGPAMRGLEPAGQPAPEQAREARP